VLNQMGRILFLMREYKEAEKVLKRVGEVDPEDLQSHYNLMLVYRGMGDNEQAAREEKLFRRFKAEESSQAITAKPRMLSPEDNNERQPIHEHESVPLPFVSPPAGSAKPVKRADAPKSRTGAASEQASRESTSDTREDR
jgi:tetratricopeptide (TPR) repeat protein